MRQVLAVELTPTQAVNIGSAACLGALTSVLAGAALQDAVGAFPRWIAVPFVVALGAGAGALPPGIRAATTPRTQLLLVYLSAAFVCGTTGVATVSDGPWMYAGVAAVVAGVSGVVLLWSTAPDHVIFVGEWLCVLAAYATGAVGLASAGVAAVDVFSGFVLVGLFAVLVGTHRVLIDERDAQMNGRTTSGR